MGPDDPHLDISSICGCEISFFCSGIIFTKVGKAKWLWEDWQLETEWSSASLNWEKVKESSVEFVYLSSKTLKQLNFKYQISTLMLYFPCAWRLKIVLHIRSLISMSSCQIVVAFSYKSACSPGSAMPKFNWLQRTSIEWNETLCWKAILPGLINKVIWGALRLRRSFF